MPIDRLSSIFSHLKNRLDLSGARLYSAMAGVIVAVLAIVAAVVVTGPADAAPSSASSERPYGQDVSAYESDHDWNASQAQFGIIKATEGLTFRDSAFARHWAELGKKGIVRGAYHYGHPGNDPIAEADHFLSVVDAQPAETGDLLVLDLETSDGRSVAQVNAWAKTWLAHVKDETGVTPLFYSGWNFADTYGHGLAEYPLWVAYYGREKGDVTPPADWKSWAIHQYTDVPIDQNVSALTTGQLRALGRP
ncbi:glycoside hydrolase family 25 protein [Sphaerisporangium rhizosphaerae]|uniref:Glycoside hydrolase family 25 protein n=1 Tax=Sphaerisporangium rhizosphaerae TaxID=2269375 RepID=A0ABW2PGZ5_9ACTN